MYGECWFTGKNYFKHGGSQNATLIADGGLVYSTQMAPPLSSVVRYWVNQILGLTVVHVRASQLCTPLLGLPAEYSFRFV